MTVRGERIVVFWGILDLVWFSYYYPANILKGKVPIVGDLMSAWSNAAAFGTFFHFWTLTIPYLILFLSLFASGVLLIRKKPAGAIVAYVQTPFRLLLVTPSISFIFLLTPNSLPDIKNVYCDSVSYWN